VITGLKIERLRGIREGELTGLAPLTILVGPNGSGKTSILEGLLIACAGNPGDAVGRGVRRRVSASHGARWITWKRGETGSTKLTASSTSGEPVITEISEMNAGGLKPGEAAIRVQSWPQSGEVPGGGLTDVAEWTVTFRTDNEYDRRGTAHRKAGFVRLIDPAPGANQSPIWKVYDRVLNAGFKREASALLAEIVDDFDDLTMSAEDDATPTLRLLYRSDSVPDASRGVPIGLAGDGVYSLTRVALELAACRSGLALLEEPEVHQYPKTLWRIAQAITAAVQRDVQVIVTTHSHELIRMLLEQSHAGSALERVAVIRLKLAAGRLVSSNLGGHEAWVATEKIGDDLR
jgi:AAA domain, putative AbiEii toxin, Type IV TA system